MKVSFSHKFLCLPSWHRLQSDGPAGQKVMHPWVFELATVRHLSEAGPMYSFVCYHYTEVLIDIEIFGWVVLEIRAYHHGEHPQINQRMPICGRF